MSSHIIVSAFIDSLNTNLILSAAAPERCSLPCLRTTVGVGSGCVASQIGTVDISDFRRRRDVAGWWPFLGYCTAALLGFGNNSLRLLFKRWQEVFCLPIRPTRGPARVDVDVRPGCCGGIRLLNPFRASRRIGFIVRKQPIKRKDGCQRILVETSRSVSSVRG